MDKRLDSGARLADGLRLARECLEIAHTFSVGAPRTILLQMAEVWQRLADQQRTAAQEKQQVQPKRR
jgi:hypothetical protein